MMESNGVTLLSSEGTTKEKEKAYLHTFINDIFKNFGKKCLVRRFAMDKDIYQYLTTDIAQSCFNKVC